MVKAILAPVSKLPSMAPSSQQHSQKSTANSQPHRRQPLFKHPGPLSKASQDAPHAQVPARAEPGGQRQA